MFSVKMDKKEMVEALQVLLQVSTVKSLGCSPNENTRIDLTPTSMTLSANSTAHQAIARDIPIELEGDLGNYNDNPLMINTKKLLASVKASSNDLVLSFKENRIKVGKGNKAFVLDGFSVSVSDIPECTFYDYKVSTEHLKKMFGELCAILKIESNWSTEGAIFKGKEAVGPCGGGFVRYADSELFTDEADDEIVFIHPDFFNAALSKVSEKECIPGITTDKTKAVLSVGRYLLCKSIRVGGNFPIDAVHNIMEKAVDSEKEKSCVICHTKMSEILSGIKESRDITESNIYTLTVKKDCVEISASNSSVGAKGKIAIEGENELPNGLESAQGNYRYDYLMTMASIFKDSEETPDIKMEIQGDVLESLYISDSQRIYYFKSLN